MPRQGGQPARPIRRGGLDDGVFAGATSISWPADHPHAQLSGDIIKHLGPVFADQMQRTTATGTGFVFDVDDDLDPRQM
jgi:hypothetical protein